MVQDWLDPYNYKRVCTIVPGIVQHFENARFFYVLALEKN